MREDWVETKLINSCEILDNLRKPINAKERANRISGKSENDLYLYYGATGQVGFIDGYLTDGEFVLVGEDGAPFFDYTKPTAYMISGKTWVNNHAHILKSLTNNKYTMYYLNQFNFKDYVSGTTRLKLTQGSLRNIPIKLPPLLEQKAIVAKIEQLFSELDKGIENLKTAQAKLKIYRQAVLKKAFEGELTKEWKEKQKVKYDWNIFKFQEITINFDGKRRPLSKQVRENLNGEYPYYGACEIIDHINDYIFDGEYLLIGEDGANLLSKAKPLAFVVNGKFWVNNHAHIVQVKDFMNIKFLEHQFNSLHINEYVTGTAQPKLNQNNLNKIPIKVPPLEEQNQIVQEIESRLSVCDKIEETIETTLAKSEALRQSILKKAFEGKLLDEQELKNIKNNPEYESAEALIKRIKKERSK